MKDRFIILNIIIYFIGVIFVFQLFNLQIVNGENYREQSERRLVRETQSYAPRGEIFDRYGKQLVTNVTGFNLQIYKTKITSEQLNEILLHVATILEKNGDSYYNDFPVDIETMQFTIGEESQKQWKQRYNIDVDKTAEEVVAIFKEKYKIVQEDREEIRKIIAMRFEIATVGYSSYKPVTLAKNISEASVMEIEEKNAMFSGINIYTQPTRKYLVGSLASHIIGYIGKISSTEYEKRKELGYTQNDYIGKSGIESTFDELLRGTNGSKRLEMDATGRISEEEEMSESTMGSSIVLTIDMDLQAATEKALESIIQKIQTGGFTEKHEDAKTGAAVVVNVKTGEILAMASYPNYNPDEFTDGISQAEYEKYFSHEDKPMFNRAIQGTYSPGSTFKMITGIAGLESAAVKIEETITDLGVYNKGHKPACWIWNSRRQTHGKVNAIDALKVSCNYYYYEIASRNGIDIIAQYARKFGLGEKTGVELVGEVSGVLSSREYVEKLKERGSTKVWTIGDTLSSSIGQSYNSFTPIQMARYISLLANRGVKTKLTIVKQVLDAEGNEVDKTQVETFVNEKLGIAHQELENLELSQENLDAIFEGMKSVTGDQGGSAYGTFSSFPIEVAGKTGTASASSGSDNAWFVGFAPYEDPEIAVVAIVEHGGHGYYTAPAVKEIMEEYFGYNNSNMKEDLLLRPLKTEITH